MTIERVLQQQRCDAVLGEWLGEFRTSPRKASMIMISIVSERASVVVVVAVVVAVPVITRGCKVHHQR